MFFSRPSVVVKKLNLCIARGQLLCLSVTRCVASWRADNLEKKMISLKNFERLQELQQQIVWQSVLELEPRTLVPEVRAPRL